MASSRVVFPAPVGPVIANKPLLAKGSTVKSIFHSPASEFRFFRRRLRIFMMRSPLRKSRFVSVPRPEQTSCASAPAGFHQPRFQCQTAFKHFADAQFAEG